MGGTDVPPTVHPVIFDGLQGPLVCAAALQTFSDASPSGVDARGWRRLCTSFRSALDDLALFARRLYCEYLSPNILSPFLACWLIALDKYPGVHPIGVCEVVRRIIAKAVLSILRSDIQEVAGTQQLCAGQPAGMEAVVHGIRAVFHRDDCEATLLVDASNAFNSLNRIVALDNIRRICPALATILINTYRSPSALYVMGDT